MAASIARTIDKWSPTAQFRQNSAEYGDLYAVARDLNIQNFNVATVGDRVVITGSAVYQLQKDLLWNAIKHLDGWERDVVVDIAVERTDIRGIHTVRPGDTLASIAKSYLGKASRESDIFEANRDRLNDPDQIFPGQQLVIPRR